MIRPVSDVLLIRLEPPKTEVAGIIRPDTRQHPIRVGRVLRCGPGRSWKHKQTGKWSFWAVEAKPGDRVVFMAALLQTGQGRQVASSFAVADDQALIHETDVLMVIDGDEDVEIDVT